MAMIVKYMEFTVFDQFLVALNYAKINQMESRFNWFTIYHKIVQSLKKCSFLSLNVESNINQSRTEAADKTKERRSTHAVERIWHTKPNIEVTDKHKHKHTHSLALTHCVQWEGRYDIWRLRHGRNEKHVYIIFAAMCYCSGGQEKE